VADVGSVHRGKKMEGAAVAAKGDENADVSGADETHPLRTTPWKTRPHRRRLVVELGVVGNIRHALLHILKGNIVRGGYWGGLVELLRTLVLLEYL
jgi:hypothetical protein